MDMDDDATLLYGPLAEYMLKIFNFTGQNGLKRSPG